MLTVKQIRLWQEEAEVYDIHNTDDVNPPPTTTERTLKQPAVDEPNFDKKIFIVCRVLHAVDAETTTQRDNVFQSRCTIGDFVCRLIINSSSCTNAAAKNLVDRLKPPTRAHPRPLMMGRH